MTGRPGYRTMEMNGGSSVSYLARTPCVPSFCALFTKGGKKGACRLPGEGGDHFHCTVEPSSGHIWCLNFQCFGSFVHIDDVELESRGPGIDPFRAGGPKWGRKWPKNGFWPHLKNGGKMARKMRKMAWKMENIDRKWPENGISAHFSHFPGDVSSIFQVRPKSIFRPFSSPFRAGGPKWIYTRSAGFQM